MIEKLFEVLSTPSLKKPSKVASTPSCAVSTCEGKIKNCKDLIKQLTHCCKENEYCFPIEEKECFRSVQSCSCILSRDTTNDEYCFVLPLPREVANYYNRAHMRNKPCRHSKAETGQGQSFCCTNPSCPLKKFHVRPLRKCCSPPQTSPPLFMRCRCSPAPSPRTSSPACQCWSCCQKRAASKPKPCPPSNTCWSLPGCPSPECCSPPPPPRCCPPIGKCVLPPRCPPSPRCCSPSPRCCSPAKCSYHQDEGCCCMRTCPPAESSETYFTRFCVRKPPKYCICGSPNPCDCKIAQIRSQCTSCCVRCGRKVYAAEKIQVSSGAFHTNCFSCYCCKKYLDVRCVYEGSGEIYCRQCYNHFFGVETYGFGGNCC